MPLSTIIQFYKPVHITRVRSNEVHRACPCERSGCPLNGGCQVIIGKTRPWNIGGNDPNTLKTSFVDFKKRYAHI
jgi:hypothetical protein